MRIHLGDEGQMQFVFSVREAPRQMREDLFGAASTKMRDEQQYLCTLFH
jgi:hypothetical protein